MTKVVIVILGTATSCWEAASQVVTTTAKNCAHGSFNTGTKNCVCDDNWRISGPTDTFHFLEGLCDQYLCSSDANCRADTGVEDALCLVPGWNCYCSWYDAFQSYGTGYETTKGKCMGVMYNISVSGLYCTNQLLKVMWVLFGILAFLCLPFGETRTLCRHHHPSILKLPHALGILSIFGWNYDCDGRCDQNRFDFYFDFAWSLYFIDMGFWFYTFVLTVSALLLFTWCVLLWLVVICILVVAGVFSCCAGAANGGGDVCQGCGNDSNGCCDGGNGCCDGGNGCCDSNVSNSDLFLYSTLNTNFYTVPSGTVKCCGGDDCCDCCNCCGGCWNTLCHPIAFLVLYFPSAPTNLWGGVFGYCCLRTHSSISPDRRYLGGNRFVDALGFRNSQESRGANWRRIVFDHLYTANAGPPTSSTAPTPQRMEGGGLRLQTPQLNEQHRHRAALSNQILQLGINQRGDEPEHFDKTYFNINSSSFDDYASNSCWICADGASEWDLWVACGHMFCTTCSSEMLKRKMPCPICRRVTPTVLRGPAQFAVCTPLLTESGDPRI